MERATLRPKNAMSEQRNLFEDSPRFAPREQKTITTRNGHVFISPDKHTCSWCGHIVKSDSGEPCKNERRIVAIHNNEKLAKSIGKPKAVMVVLRRTIAKGDTVVDVIAYMLEPKKPKRMFL